MDAHGAGLLPPDLTAEFVERLRAAAEKAGLFDDLAASWLLLDAELLPWNAKAGQLLRDQYAPVGAAARSALPAAIDALETASGAGRDVAELLARTRRRAANADAFTDAYRRYCWPTDGLSGVRIAPFQLLATDRATYHDPVAHLASGDRRPAGRGRRGVGGPHPTAAGGHHRRGLGRGRHRLVDWS